MISILMPFKNEGFYIEEAVNSILSQTVENFELIAINDHSTDDSVSIFEKMAVKDSRLNLYHNPGTGIIDGLRFAATIAQGHFITRQDADDLMPINKLRELKLLLEENGPGHISTGNIKYFSDNNLGEGFKKYEEWINRINLEQSHKKNIFKECVLVSSNWMLMKEDFIKINGFNDSIYPEDYHFAFKVIQYGFKILTTKTTTHFWRDHSMRASRNLEVYKDQKFFSLKVQYFKKNYAKENICLWGAGRTGKKLAKELIKQNIQFHWVTNNERKHNKIIYGVKINSLEALLEISKPHVIISVTQRGAMHSIYTYLAKCKLEIFFEF